MIRLLPRRVARAAGAAAAGLIALAALPQSAGAIDTSPRHAYDAVVSSAGVQISGTYTPIIGNFAGNLADDILWYAPGPAPDSLWTSTGRGTFAKRSLSINGTYTPLAGDFGGDAFDDILWYAPGTTPDALWTSVVGANPFTSTPVAVNGTFRPVVLDLSMDLAVYRTSYPDSLPKDAIVWYRPGAAADFLWSYLPNGSHTDSPIDIAGSPQLIPFAADGDPFQDLLAYSPGSGPDALYRYDTGALLKTSKTVNGTYTPQVVGGGYLDSILWLGPGTARDALWANLDWGGLTDQATQAVNGTRVVPYGIFGGNGYIYEPNGTDRVFVDGYVLGSLDPDVGPGATPLTGDFDGDHAIDTFFYRPGAGTEAVGYGHLPLVP